MTHQSESLPEVWLAHLVLLFLPIVDDLVEIWQLSHTPEQPVTNNTINIQDRCCVALGKVISCDVIIICKVNRVPIPANALICHRLTCNRQLLWNIVWNWLLLNLLLCMQDTFPAHGMVKRLHSKQAASWLTLSGRPCIRRPGLWQICILRLLIGLGLYFNRPRLHYALGFWVGLQKRHLPLHPHSPHRLQPGRLL